MQIMVHSSHLEAKDFEQTAVEHLRYTIRQLALKVFFAHVIIFFTSFALF